MDNGTTRIKKVAIMTNLPSPYRVDFFAYLQENYKEYDFSIIFQAGNGASFRQWDGEVNRLKNVCFLNGAGIKNLDTKADQKEFFITRGVNEVLAEIKPDVCVIAEYNQTAIMMRRFCVKHGIPYVSWTDGTIHSERNLHFYHRISRKYLISRAASFIASSSDSADNQVKLGAERRKIHVSELAVDIHRFEGCGEAYNPDGYMLAVGSLVNRKGLDLLLRALSHCSDIDYLLHLVGTGDAEKDLRNLSEELNISDKVVFKGFLQGQELVNEYCGSGLYLFPTREDCFGLVTLEAMCCGIPVIGSKYAASSRDLIEEGKTGYIVDPYDEKAFSETIRRTFLDKDLLKEMSKAAKKASEKYDFKNTSIGYIDAINEALVNGRKKR